MKNNKLYLEYNDLPACIKGQMISFVMLAAGLLIFGISTAVAMHSFKIFLFALVILVAYSVYCVSWILPFLKNQIIVIEGKIKEIDEGDKQQKGILGKVVKDITRFTFTLDVDGKEIKVVKTGNKIKRKDSDVTLYVPEDSIFSRQDGTVFIGRVMYIEVKAN